MKSLSLARVLPVLENFESPRPDTQRTEQSHLGRQDLARHEAARPELRIVETEAAVVCGADPELEASGEAAQRHWQEGYEAGVSVGRAQAEAGMRDQDQLLHDAVAAARAEWVRLEGERIAGGIEKALNFLESEISTVASRVLAQITSGVLRDRAIADFTSHVRSLLRDGAAGVVTIHAPEDLIAALSDSLAHALGGLGSIEFAPHEGAEVWVRSGATMIEAPLDAWRNDHFSEA